MRTGQFLALLFSIVSMATAFHWPVLAHAKSCSGGDCSGGGSSVCTAGRLSANCDELLDTHMMRNRFSVTDSEAYRDVVEPMLKNLEKSLPDFAVELRAGLTKKWYLSNSKLPKLSPEANGTQLPHRQVAVQYQNANEVWIDGPWFNRRPKDEQAAIIVHELAVQMYLRQAKVKEDEYVRANPHTSAEVTYRHGYHGKITMNKVRQLTELLMTKPLADMKELQEEVDELAFGSYLTGKTKPRFVAYKAKIYAELKNACKLSDEGDSDTSPRRLAAGPILQKLGNTYDAELKRLFDNKKVHGENAETEESVNNHYLGLLVRYLSETRESGLMNIGYARFPTRTELNGEVTVPRRPKYTFSVPYKGEDGKMTSSPPLAGGDHLTAICDFVSKQANGPKKRSSDIFETNDATSQTNDAR